jgi:Protein of unknown function (DUF3703)
MTVTLNAAYTDEIAAFWQARVRDDQIAAWHHLERAHILGQLKFGLHLKSHWTMLAYALHLRQPSEVAGQIIRLILVPVGNLTGRLPWGNIGRSNVSAFATMELPDDLHAIIEAARR